MGDETSVVGTPDTHVQRQMFSDSPTVLNVETKVVVAIRGMHRIVVHVDIERHAASKDQLIVAGCAARQIGTVGLLSKVVEAGLELVITPEQVWPVPAQVS